MRDRPTAMAIYATVRHSWTVQLLLLLLAGASVVVTGLGLRKMHIELAESKRLSHIPKVQALTLAPPLQQDFTSNWSTVPSKVVLSILDQTARSSGVELLSQVITDQPSTKSELGRQEFSLGLRGPYTSTMRALSEIHNRLPTATVRRLRMVPDAASTGQISTSLVISVWSKPIVADALTAQQRERR